MKKTLFLLLISVFAANNIFAEAIFKYRDNCNNGPKYTAKSRVWCVGPFIENKGTACAGSTARSYAELKYSNGSFKVWQKAEVSDAGAVQSHRVFIKRCGRGTPFADFILRMRDVASTLTGDDSTGNESGRLTNGPVAYNSSAHTISIPSISGYIRSQATDYRSIFKIIIWQPIDSNDENITTPKIKWQASATYVNGVLTLSNFSSSEISLVNTDSGYVVLFNNFGKTVTLENETVSNLQVHIETHSEADAPATISQVTGITDNLVESGELTFNIYPNPTADKVTVNFDGGDINNSRIFLYDLNGKLVDDFKTIKIYQNKKSLQFTGDISSLPSGTYFISIMTDKNIYVRKLIKK